MLARVLAVACLAGCYHPELADCSVRCSSPGDCATGQVCRVDGYCAAPGATACGEHPETDAPMQTGDGAPPADARDLCEQGCSKGHCEGGVCVIDCSAGNVCPDDVTCPANLPCKVVCGDHSCDHHVFCQYATSCEVDCVGDTACGDVIQCGTGPCQVTCSGPNSCHKHTACSMSCDCDVACTGIGSCPEASQCPLGTSCRLGNGCSSSLPGCKTC